MTLFQNAGIALIAAVALAGCAASPRIQDGIVINDPYEAQNRRVHDFNKALDARVVGPVARLASSGAGDPAGAGRAKPVDLVINMGSNLSLPGKVLNQLLQGRPGPAVQIVNVLCHQQHITWPFGLQPCQGQMGGIGHDIGVM